MYKFKSFAEIVATGQRIKLGVTNDPTGRARTLINDVKEQHFKRFNPLAGMTQGVDYKLVFELA